MLIDESRIVDIIKEHYHIIYSFCFSQLKSEADAKDVTQDVFFLMMEKSEKLNDNNLRAWLFEVASKKIKVKFRELAKYSGCIYFDDDTCEVPDCVTDVYFFEKEEELDDEKILEMKEDILSRLTPDEQEIYNDFYVKKMQYSEIAQKLGISEKAANVRSFRLKQKIKKMVKAIFSPLLLLIFLIF